MFLDALPAYGRDYLTKREVLAAWNTGKDFQIVEVGQHYGRYVNKADAPENVVLNVRYKKQRMVCPIKT